MTNQFDSGIGIRSVIGTRTRDQQAIGSLVCKNGMTTNHTCGTISSACNQRPYANFTWA